MLSLHPFAPADPRVYRAHVGQSASQPEVHMILRIIFPESALEGDARLVMAKLAAEYVRSPERRKGLFHAGILFICNSLSRTAIEPAIGSDVVRQTAGRSDRIFGQLVFGRVFVGGVAGKFQDMSRRQAIAPRPEYQPPHGDPGFGDIFFIGLEGHVADLEFLGRNAAVDVGVIPQKRLDPKT